MEKSLGDHSSEASSQNMDRVDPPAVEETSQTLAEFIKPPESIDCRHDDPELVLELNDPAKRVFSGLGSTVEKENGLRALAHVVKGNLDGLE
jgi:hypothetical protein